MKREQFYEYQAKYGKTFDSSCFYIDPDDVIQFDQKRADGDQRANELRYQQQFLTGVKQVAPISVIPLGGGKFKVKDGTTRTKGAQGAKKENWQGKLFASDFQHRVLGYGPNEWEDEQDRANDHLGEKPASKKTLVNACEERVKSGRYDSIVQDENGGVFLDKSKPEDFSKYVELASKWTKRNLFPNSSQSWVWFKHRIEDAINGIVPMTSRVKTYNTNEMLTRYSSTGGTGYHNPTDDIKKVSGGERVIEVLDPKRVKPNVYGKILHYILNGDCTTITIILNYTNSITNSKTCEEIQTQRISDTIAVASAVNLLSEEARGRVTVCVKSMPQLLEDQDKIITTWQTGDPIPVLDTQATVQKEFDFGEKRIKVIK